MAAPSFSSFPELDPGPSSRPEERQKGSKRSRERDGERARHQDKDKDKDEDKHKRRKHSSHRDSAHKERHHSSSRTDRRHDKDKGTARLGDRERPSERARDSEPASTASSSLYIADRHGDQFNVLYGGLHASSIPRYYRRSKRVVGLSGAFLIASDRGKGVEIGLLGKRRARRYTDHHAALVLRESRVRRLQPTGRPFPRESEDQGFIPLSRSRHHHHHQPRASSFRELLADDEQGSSTSTSDSESPHDSSEDEDFVASLTAEQEAIKSLEASLAQNPSSLSSWLSLLSYSLASIPDDSKNVLKARAEITLSVFSRALKAHESNGRSARFRVTYLRAGESVWSAEQQHHEWEDALRAVSNKPQIWLAWYNWRLKSRMRVGDVSGVADDAARALHALTPSEIGRVGILWRSAMFFKEAGYHERATAVLQAQVELSLFCPQSILGAAFESLLPSLEEFWESEVPRVGEAHARGWAASMSEKSSDFSSAHPPDPAVASQESLASDPYYRWYEDERRRDAQGHLPMRTSADSDDPYATVLFSDIRNFLSPIRSREGIAWLRYAWLSVSGLHIPGLSAAFDRILAENHMDIAEPSDCWMLPYDTQFFDRLFPSSVRHADVDCDVVAGVIVAKEVARSPVFGPVKEWALSALHPLAGTGPRGEGRMWELHDVQGLDHSLIRRFFEQTKSASHDDEWAILSVAFEAAISLKNAGRLSKALLAQSPDSLALWCTHARLERIRGRNDEARKVYIANLTRGAGAGARSASSQLARSGEAQMWWDWAEMEWLDGKADASLKVVYTACAVELSGGIGVLKAKRVLDDRITQGSPDSSDQRAWICLCALFELLTTGSVTAALSAFSQQGGHGRSDAEREAMEIASLLLVYHHAHTLRVPCPPAVLREHVEASLGRYPENSVVLGVFLEAERGQSIWGRVRKLYGESTTAASHLKRLIRRVWDIWAAGRERGYYDGERVRQVLTAATMHYRASPLLWKLLVELEIRLASVSRGKTLVFRGTGECPWVKDLYLLAYGPLRRAFSSDELNRWMESMAERGLRIRLEIEPYLQGYDGSREDGDAGSDAADSDIEHNAQELRRLMPY